MSNKIKKTIFLLNVDNYSPEITELTYPFIYKYAEKIGADVFIIKDRKYPDMPVVYEKLQIYDLAKEIGSDWNIYIDSDTLIHPETIDFTELIHKDTVLNHGCDMANIRWRYDEYFRRDGRNIGTCGWFSIVSDWCLDFYKPTEMSLEEMLNNVFPTVEELNTVVNHRHLIDDYVVSQNVARFGLKYKTAIELLKENRLEDSNFFFHIYTVPEKEKVEKMKEVIKLWKLNGTE